MDKKLSDDFILSHNLFKTLSDYSLSCIYNGQFSQKLTDNVLALAESNMNIVEEPSSVRKRVYFILVESLQNITRHNNTEAIAKVQRGCFFMIQKIEENYLVTSANPVENTVVDGLKVKLETVNNMNQDELKSYYKQILDNGEMSDKGGAGLGLIEIARKSGNKLAFKFNKISDDYSCFFFQTKTGKTDETQESINNEASQLVSAEKTYGLISQKNIDLIYKGDFSQENLKSVLAITEESFKGQDGFLMKKKLFNVIVEIIQNIYKHAYSYLKEGKQTMPGIFMIESLENGHIVIAGNLVENTKVDLIKSRIDEVNNCTMEELDTLFNNKIMEEDFPAHGGAGLGFIDLKIKSGNNLHYYFNKIDEQLSFYAVQVVISSSN